MRGQVNKYPDTNYIIYFNNSRDLKKLSEVEGKEQYRDEI
jgi:hypothetical protein